MIVLDTDVLTNFFNGRADVVSAVGLIPAAELALTVVTCEEMLRGWLGEIRKAESRTDRTKLTDAYWRLGKVLEALPQFELLPYTPEAEALLHRWQIDKVKAGKTKDRRIAATCVTQGATLVTHNRRDFDRVPGLKLTVWN